MTKADIIENLEALLAAVEAQPEPLLDLGYWQKLKECGTCFCVAGLAASMPKFQALGLNWACGSDGFPAWPEYEGLDMLGGGGDTLFGENSMRELFRPSGEGTLDTKLGLSYEKDEEWGDVEMSCTDKELAIARLKYRIKQYKENA